MIRRTLSLVFILLLSLFASACDSRTAADHLNSARSLVAADDHRAAVIELKNALQKDPALAEARFLLAQSEMALGDYGSALVQFERALDLGYSNDELLEGLYRSKLRVGRHQEVIGALAEQANLDGAMAALLGDAYLAAGDEANASANYLRAGERPEALMGLGTLAWMNERPEEARALFDRALTLVPADRDLLLRKAEFELAETRTDAAVAAFEEARAQPGASVAAGIGLTRAYLSEGRLTEAQQAIDAVKAEAPALFIAHYLDALIKFQQEDLDGAEASLREAQIGAVEFPPSNYLLGAIKYQQGQYSQAEDSLRRYLARVDRDPSAAKLLAAIQLEDGEAGRVLELLRPYLRDSTDPQLLAMAGTAALQSGEAGEATELLRRAVDLAPDAAAFRNQLALTLLASGRDEEAGVELDAALTTDTDQYQSDYLKTLLSLKNEQYEDALAAADAFLAKQDDPIGHNLRGAALLAMDRAEEAEAAFNAALAIDATYFPAAINLSRIAESEGRGDEAAAPLEAVLAAAPDSASAALALADLHARAGRGEDAEAALLALVALEPDAYRAHLGLVRLYLPSGRLQQATDHIEVLLRVAPDAVDSHLLAAQLALRLGDGPRAAEHAAAAWDIARENDIRPATRQALSSLLRDVGNLEAAQAALAGLEADNPDVFNLESARLVLRQGQAEEARKYLERIQVDVPAVRMTEAQILEVEGRLDDALLAYAALIETGYRDALLRAVLISSGRGEMNQALKLAEDWLEAEPEDTGVMVMRADVLLQSGRVSDALAQYEAIMPIDNPVVLNNMAWLYMERGDSRALAMAERARALAPANADIADTLGWILVKEGRPAEAIEHLELSARTRPSSGVLHYHLGVALQEAGRGLEARTALERAVDLGGFNELGDAVERLEKL